VAARGAKESRNSLKNQQGFRLADRRRSTAARIKLGAVWLDLLAGDFFIASLCTLAGLKRIQVCTGDALPMSQKIAFITGGNRGLGFQTALDLKDHDVKVVIGSRDLAAGEKTVEKLRAAGVDADVLRFDITRAADYQVAFDYFDSKYGRLDILVNNAGVAGGSFPVTGPEHSVAEAPAGLLERVFETNFFAQVALTRALLPLILKSTAGRIVNLSSILGSLTLHANPDSPIYHAKSFAYDASKTALNAFTIHLAYELRDTKIKVNSAHPGWVKTDMGGPDAPMELGEGGKTSAALATLPEDGPTGGFFHLGQALPW
jgi:NAD(P)-dependent dehydrogenase (short-subunit alcohol dehydrogenase family)